jgi:glutamate-1-semialdehyde 2,1-aminomutase
MKAARNAKLFSQARHVIPGGVNSPVRAMKAVGARPIFVEKAKGAHLYDADGRWYIDYCCSWGPMILGHARKEVLSEVKKVMDKGTSFGVPTELETRLARMIVQAVGSIEKVRLVNSGTEAVMTAIRLARAYTGREKIIKFVGCYHGHVDHLLVKAGSGLTTLGAPSSPGVPRDFTKHTILLPFNNIEAARRAFEKYAGQIAAVIVEPVAGNMGVIPPANSFLQGLRRLCSSNKSVLVFDEVITGFRLCYGSAQEILGVKADLTCLGKIIGGGFPIGACGGKAAIMNRLAPEGKVYQAGTLSGNPVCVAGGLATLKILKAHRPYNKLEKLAKALCGHISETLGRKGVQHCINQIGSMFTVFFNPGPVSDYASAVKSDTGTYARYFRGMLKNGIYLPPSQFESCFISTAHTQRDLALTLSALERAI